MTPKLIAQAIKGHHAFFTTGPIVNLTVNGGIIGNLVPARGGKALADITVKAAPWISVERVTLYVNGKEARRWSVAPAGGERPVDPTLRSTRRSRCRRRRTATSSCASTATGR